MQLKSLKVFCDVVGWRSFSRAASENGISQSGASQVVHQLEERLGVKLIDRSKRPFVLTPEGEAYYEGCRKLVQRFDALEDQVRTLHDDVAGRVRVVSIYSVGLHHMSQYLQKFLGRYPKANVRLEYQHPHRVYEAVEKDQADIGLVSYPRPSRTIEATVWREEPMVLVCAPGHRLAGRSPIALSELSGEKMIGFDSDLTIRHEIDRVLQLQQADVSVVMEFDNIETIKRAVEIDAGVALLPEPTITRELEIKSLVKVPLANVALVRPIGIIHRRGKELGGTTQRFMDMLLDESAWEQADFENSSTDQKAVAGGGRAVLVNEWRNGHQGQSTNGIDFEPDGSPGAADHNGDDKSNGHASDDRSDRKPRRRSRQRVQ
jgi:DNA-binding transcriptional LysR family regulator